MRWFTGIHTAEQAKQRYHELVKMFHPDNGGTGNEIKEIISEFKEIWSRVKNVHYNEEKRETYERETDETADEFIDIINALLRFEGVVIEICGSWIWLSGNTYPVKDQLKELGCRWSKGKKKWYFTHDEWRPSVFHKSMSEIRSTYGSKVIRPRRNYEIGCEG